MVFYRTYRPQLISELDKTDIRDRMLILSKSGSFPHAFLFSGSRGTGKTSTARILARIVNCEKLRKGEPCNTCDNCLAILNGTHLDVIEIDAASNRGIDEIRQLRETIAYTPSMGKKKIYIIDEVHMLTREAFNALLKTLEEPPEHVMFILATTESHKLPDTIISRCIQFIFSKATPAELKRSLSRVVKGEDITISDASLTLIATSADGSFRDAVKVLEQAVLENKLKDVDIQELIGLSGSTELIDVMLAGEVKKALSHIEQKQKNGANILLFIQSLLTETHKRLVADPSLTEIKLLTKYLMRAHQETKTSYIPQLPLELAVIEYCNQRSS